MKKSLVVVFGTLALSVAAFAPCYGAGMMGGGMMSGGMMGQSSAEEPAARAANPRDADALLAYIRKNHLSCAQCHSISGNGFGPSFASVSASYANRDDAAAVLKDHIAHGFRRMPGGMANEAESAHLAEMILDLEKTRGLAGARK